MLFFPIVDFVAGCWFPQMKGPINDLTDNGQDFFVPLRHTSYRQLQTEHTLCSTYISLGHGRLEDGEFDKKSK